MVGGPKNEEEAVARATAMRCDVGVPEVPLRFVASGDAGLSKSADPVVVETLLERSHHTFLVVAW